MFRSSLEKARSHGVDDSQQKLTSYLMIQSISTLFANDNDPPWPIIPFPSIGRNLPHYQVSSLCPGKR